MCVHPSIANCFKYYPLASNQSSVASENASQETIEADEVTLKATLNVPKIEFILNSNSNKDSGYSVTQNTSTLITQHLSTKNWTNSSSEITHNMN